MPSRQERRKAERDAAKRAPAQAGAAGAEGASAARASVNPVGDWTTQAGDPSVLIDALGFKVLKQKAVAGDRQGLTLVHFPAQREHLLRDTPGGFSGSGTKDDSG